MTNGDRGAALFTEVLASISKVYGWGRFEPAIKTLIPMTAAEKEAYTGLFVANEELKFSLKVAEGELQALQVGSQEPVQLYPDSTDRFFDITDGTTIQFYRQDDGTVEGFEVQGYRFEKQLNNTGKADDE